jgi:hypothetical protein
LGVAGTTPIDQALITRILDYLEPVIRKQLDPTPGIFNPIYEQKLRDWRAGTQKDLTERWMGKAIGTLPPNPLDWGPNVRQTELSDVTNAVGNAVNQALAGAADVVGKGLILVAIGGLMLMGVRLLFREPAVIVQPGAA